MIIKKEKDFNKIKFKESEKGITLIALVITIIVLLILAAVSIAMLTGENGILKKASTAKEKHQISEAKEKIELALQDLRIEEESKGNSLTKKELSKLSESEYEINVGSTESFPVEVVQSIYKFQINDKYQVEYLGEATGTIVTYKTKPEGYTNQDKVTIILKVKNSKGIKEIQTPNSENTIYGNGKIEIATDYTVYKNGTYTFKVIDNENKEETKDIIIDKIDKDAPTSCAIKAEVKDGAIEVTTTAVDAETRSDGTSNKSGLGKYECYVKGEKKGESTDGTFKIENLSGGTYSVYVIAYDKAGNSKQSDPVNNLKVSVIMKDITAQMVAEHPAQYYGLKVTNYESKNGQKDWKIFYSDGEHIFLITGDYVDLSVANRLNSNTGMTKIGTKYRAKWSSTGPNFQTNKDSYGNDIDNIVKKRFKATGYTLNSSKFNSRFVSTLLNASNWESYKDNNGMAEYAIGGSTIEMWMDSWNNLYKDIDGELYCNNTNENGYYVGTSSNPTSTTISYKVMSAKDGYNNSLYYPHHKKVSDGKSECTLYWLASPAAYNSASLLEIACNGDIDTYNPDEVGVRPVVSLNSGIKVNATDAE